MIKIRGLQHTCLRRPAEQVTQNEPLPISPSRSKRAQKAPEAPSPSAASVQYLEHGTWPPGGSPHPPEEGSGPRVKA